MSTPQGKRNIFAAELEEIGTRLFDAVGSPHQESKLVSQILVRSSSAGHDSHGVIRFVQYIRDVQAKRVVPGAPLEIEKETPSTALVNGHHGWGQVVAHKAMKVAIEKAAASGVGIVVARNSQHVGRLGEYPVMAASRDMIGQAFLNSYGGQDQVAPWGGIEARLAPNPLAFAAPSGEPWPILLDMTTSVVPEGKVRQAKYENRQLPEGCLIDADGNPTTDPAALYGSPRGMLLTLGGAAGHKGYGLNVMAELLGGALSGVGCRGQEPTGAGNGVFFQVINIAHFIELDEFIENVRAFIKHVKSARKRAGVNEILFPGEPEYRAHQRRCKEGIPVAESIWQELSELSRELGVKL